MELRGSWEENVSLFLLYVPLVLSPDPAHSQGKDLVISGSFIGCVESAVLICEQANELYFNDIVLFHWFVQNRDC